MCTEKKFFYQNERGEFMHFFVAEIDEYLMLLLLYVLCPLTITVHIHIIQRFCCLWTQKCVGGKLLNWFCTAICGTEGVLMHCLWANCFCVTEEVINTSIQNNNKFYHERLSLILTSFCASFVPLKCRICIYLGLMWYVNDIFEYFWCFSTF